MGEKIDGRNLRSERTKMQVLENVANWKADAVPVAAVVARKMGVDFKTVKRHATWLEARGLLERKALEPDNARSPQLLVITTAGRRLVDQCGKLSNVGTIEQVAEPEQRGLLREYDFVHAGALGAGVESDHQLVTLEARFGVRPENDYLFPVRGDCMWPVASGGDVVAMRPCSMVAAGEYVHVDVCLNGDWEPLLREYRADEAKGVVYLTHLNPARTTVALPGEQVRVSGRLVGLWRDESLARRQIEEQGHYKEQMAALQQQVEELQRQLQAQAQTQGRDFLASNGEFTAMPATKMPGDCARNGSGKVRSGR